MQSVVLAGVPNAMVAGNCNSPPCIGETVAIHVTVDESGTMHVPKVAVQPSGFSSPGAREAVTDMSWDTGESLRRPKMILCVPGPMHSS